MPVSETQDERAGPRRAAPHPRIVVAEAGYQAELATEQGSNRPTNHERPESRGRHSPESTSPARSNLLQACIPIVVRKAEYQAVTDAFARLSEHDQEILRLAAWDEVPTR